MWSVQRKLVRMELVVVSSSCSPGIYTLSILFTVINDVINIPKSRLVPCESGNWTAHGWDFLGLTCPIGKP